MRIIEQVIEIKRQTEIEEGEYHDYEPSTIEEMTIIPIERIIVRVREEKLVDEYSDRHPHLSKSYKVFTETAYFEDWVLRGTHKRGNQEDNTGAIYEH